MPETVIDGVAGHADFKIGTQSYKTNINRFRTRMDARQLDVTVFSSEPNNENNPGPQESHFDLGGILKQGAASSGPMIPLPQGVALTFQFTTACTISYTGNFESAEAERIANQPGTIAASGVSTGAVVVAWNQGS